MTALVDIKGKTRGKATREVTYKGIGKFVSEEVEKRDDEGKLVKDADGKQVMVTEQVLKTSGVVTEIKDLLEIHGGNMQELIDNAVIGFNLNAFKAASDSLSEFIKDSWTAANIAAFRLAVNNLLKLGIDLNVAVQVASSKLPS